MLLLEIQDYCMIQFKLQNFNIVQICHSILQLYTTLYVCINNLILYGIICYRGIPAKSEFR